MPRGDLYCQSTLPVSGSMAVTVACSSGFNGDAGVEIYITPPIKRGWISKR